MDAQKELQNIGAILTQTHVVYTSGKHGSAYVNKDAVYPHTELTSRLCLEMAKLYEKDDIEVVVAPAIGAVILCQWIAYHLSQLYDHEVFSVYAEKAETSHGDDFVIKRGYDRFIAHHRCLIVEDVVNTGGSLLKVIRKVRELQGDVVGAVALCNRGGVTTSDLDKIPRLESLINVNLDAWDPKSCPLCAKGVPINTNVGKAKKP